MCRWPKRCSGLRSYGVNAGAIASAAGESPYHLLAILGFDSMASIQYPLGSPEGLATASDLANFAQAGVELLMFDTKLN